MDIHKNIQMHAIKMHKFANRMSLNIINEIFKSREINHYNLRHASQIIAPQMQIFNNGTRSVWYLGTDI